MSDGGVMVVSAVGAVLLIVFVLNPYQAGCERRQAANMRRCAPKCAPYFVGYASEKTCTCDMTRKWTK